MAVTASAAAWARESLLSLDLSASQQGSLVRSLIDVIHNSMMFGEFPGFTSNVFFFVVQVLCEDLDCAREKCTARLSQNLSLTLSKTKSPANADSELGNVCSNVMRKLMAGDASETPANAGKVKVDYLGTYDVREVQLWVIVEAMDQVMTM